MWSAFVWLSGADPDILARCTNLRRSERIRFASLGAMTAIPAVLGTCSMAYAMSTLTHDPRLYLAAGLTWGCIVLIIDRYLVSTVYKSTVNKLGGRIGSVLARLLFGLLVGITVSHPLVLLWFNDSIHQT